MQPGRDRPDPPPAGRGDPGTDGWTTVQGVRHGPPLPRRIVLTGGASQLACLKELAEDVFRAPVRLAKPANVKGLGETYSSPAFAAAAGLLRWDLMGGPDASRSGVERAIADPGGSLVKQVFGWVQKNF